MGLTEVGTRFEVIKKPACISDVDCEGSNEGDTVQESLSMITCRVDEPDISRDLRPENVAPGMGDLQKTRMSNFERWLQIVSRMRGMSKMEVC